MIELKKHSTAWYNQKAPELIKKRHEVAEAIEPLLRAQHSSDYGVYDFDNETQFRWFQIHSSLLLRGVLKDYHIFDIP